MSVGTKWRYFLFLTILSLKEASSSQEIMTKLTIGFTKAFEKCSNELNLQDNILQEFYNFWKEDHNLDNRDVGCIILCMASKHDLLAEDLTMHHEKAHEFAKSHGADDTMAKQLVTMIHQCEQDNKNIDDKCTKILETTKCFRLKIHEMKWTPSIDAVVQEFWSM